jgi:predicted MFS family arabinose efflux permease
VTHPSRGELGALFAGRLIVNTSRRFVYPFLPAIARGLGVSLEQAGLLVSVEWASGIATPAVVAVAGRGERRRRQALTGLALFAAGAAITAATSVFVGAFVGFVLMGLGKPAFDIASQSFVADRTPYERRARYLSILELTWAGGFIIGAPLAGLAIDRLGWASPFWLLAAAAVLVAPSLWRVLGDETSVAPTARGRLRIERPGLALLIVAGLFSMAAEVMFVVLGAYFEDDFGLSLVALGGTGLLIGLAELSGEGAVIAFTDRIGKERAVVIGLAVSAAGFGLLATTPTSLTLALALVCVAFAGFEFTVVSAIPLATEVVPTARARYLAVLLVAYSVGRTVGAAAGAPLFNALGPAGNAVLAASADILAIAVLVAGFGGSAEHPGQRGGGLGDRHA